jgi:hypothetical protein
MSASHSSFLSVIKRFPKQARFGIDADVHPFIEQRRRHFGAADVVFVDDFAEYTPTRASVAVYASAVNPMTDFEIVRRAIEALQGAGTATFSGPVRVRKSSE